jgi:hypothetical protein
MVSTTELEGLLLVFCAIFTEDWDFFFFDENTGCGCACCMISPGASLLGTLEASALFGTAVETLKFESIFVDFRHIDDSLLSVDCFGIRLWQIVRTKSMSSSTIICEQ